MQPSLQPLSPPPFLITKLTLLDLACQQRQGVSSVVLTGVGCLAGLNFPTSAGDKSLFFLRVLIATFWVLTSNEQDYGK